MIKSKLDQVAWLWGIALAASTLLTAAGRRWPDPLPINFGLILVLLLALPLAMVAWLLAHWRLASIHQEGESNDSVRESL